MELTIRKALLAVQEMGIEADGCEIKYITLSTNSGIIGYWYDEEFTDEILEQEMDSINISMDKYKVTIVAIKN